MTPTFNFDNAELLTSSTQNLFFGDHFNYKQETQLSVRGSVLDLSARSGVSGVYSQISGFLSAGNDYGRVILNGWDLGRGRIESVSFEGADDFREKTYNVSLLIESSGDYSDFTGSYYSGVDYRYFKNIQSFTETINYSKDTSNSETYTHSVDLQMSREISGHDPRAYAKFTAFNLFNNTNLTGFVGSYSNNFSGYKQVFSENFGVYDFSYGFNREITKPTGNLDYITNRSISTTLDQAGIVNVEESAEIRTFKLPLEGVLRSGIQSEIAGSYARCNASFANYITGDVYSLKTTPVNKSVQLNNFEGVGNYSVAYTNDPKFQSTYIWESTLSIDRDVQGIFSVSENGSVIGFGRPFVNKFSNAQAGYATVFAGAQSRLQSFYNKYGAGRTIYLKSTSRGKSEAQGFIDYSVEYSDEKFESAGNVRYYEDLRQTEKRVDLTVKYNVFNVDEIVQKQRNLTPGKFSQKILVEGTRNMSLGEAVSFAKGKAATPPGSPSVLVDAKYSFDPVNHSLTMDLSKEYF